jgi:hypothetical protein
VAVVQASTKSAMATTAQDGVREIIMASGGVGTGGCWEECDVCTKDGLKANASFPVI